MMALLWQKYTINKKEPKYTQQKRTVTQNNETVFAVSPVSDHEILKILGDLKESAACWDELRPNMIRHVKQDIKLPLAHICNLSFGTGVYPSDLK